MLTDVLSHLVSYESQNPAQTVSFNVGNTQNNMVSQGYMLLLLLLLLLVASVGESYGVQLPGYCICYVRNIFTSGWGIEPHIALQQRPLDACYFIDKK